MKSGHKKQLDLMGHGFINMSCESLYAT